MSGNLYYYFYLICLFLIACLNISIGVSNQGNMEYLIIGFILLFIFGGLVGLKNSVRELGLLIAKLFIFLVYAPIWVLLIFGKLSGFSGIAVFSLAPVFIISLMTISCLAKESVIKRFKGEVEK